MLCRSPQNYESRSHDVSYFGIPDIVHARGRIALSALPEVELDLDFMEGLSARDDDS